MKTANLRNLADELDKVRATLLKEETVLASLEVRNGQDFTTNISVCGKQFQLVSMGRNYMPEGIASMDLIRNELIKCQIQVVHYYRGVVEGVEFKLRQATRSS